MARAGPKRESCNSCTPYARAADFAPARLTSHKLARLATHALAVPAAYPTRAPAAVATFAASDDAASVASTLARAVACERLDGSALWDPRRPIDPNPFARLATAGAGARAGRPGP